MVTQPGLSDAELAVLRVLWAEGRAPAGRVQELMNDAGRTWAYTTTKTILDRLEAKGYARRDRSGIPHVFSAGVTLQELARSRIARLGQALFPGANLPFVHALLDSMRLSESEIEELRASLDRLEAGPGSDAETEA